MVTKNENRQNVVSFQPIKLLKPGKLFIYSSCTMMNMTSLINYITQILTATRIDMSSLFLELLLGQVWLWYTIFLLLCFKGDTQIRPTIITINKISTMIPCNSYQNKSDYYSITNLFPPSSSSKFFRRQSNAWEYNPTHFFVRATDNKLSATRTRTPVQSIPVQIRQTLWF